MLPIPGPDRTNVQEGGQAMPVKTCLSKSVGQFVCAEMNHLVFLDRASDAEVRAAEHLHPDHPGAAIEGDGIVAVDRVKGGQRQDAANTLAGDERLIDKTVKAFAADVSRPGFDWTGALTEKTDRKRKRNSHPPPPIRFRSGSSIHYSHQLKPTGAAISKY